MKPLVAAHSFPTLLHAHQETRGKKLHIFDTVLSIVWHQPRDNFRSKFEQLASFVLKRWRRYLTLMTSSARAPCPLPKDTTARLFSIPIEAANFINKPMGSAPRERTKTHGVFSSTSANTCLIANVVDRVKQNVRVVGNRRRVPSRPHEEMTRRRMCLGANVSNLADTLTCAAIERVVHVQAVNPGCLMQQSYCR